METEKLNSLYENTRQHLQQTETLEQEINELKNKRLKEKLIVMLRTLQADALVISSFILDCSLCEDDSDIDSLIDCADDDDSFTDQTTFFEN